MVREHLEVFFHGAQNLKPEPSHVKEVCFLCVQCMEVRKLNCEMRLVQLELNLLYISEILLISLSLYGVNCTIKS